MPYLLDRPDEGSVLAGHAGPHRSGAERVVQGVKIGGFHRLPEANGAAVPVAGDAGSGLHFCFAAPARQSVAAFHAAALATGGRDNGAPGLRVDYGPDYYAAFVVDPDGYRIEAHCGRAE